MSEQEREMPDASLNARLLESSAAHEDGPPPGSPRADLLPSGQGMGGAGEELDFWRLLVLFMAAPRSNVVLLAGMGALTLANVAVSAWFAAPLIGAFYQSLLQRDLAAFGANCKAATVLFMALSFLDSTAQFFSDVLAVRWRARLTDYMHRRYLHPGNLAFCWLASSDPDNRDHDSHPLRTPSGVAAETACGLLPCPYRGPRGRERDSHGSASPAGKLSAERPADVANADQRIVADAKLLCDTLADTAQKVISAPVMITVNALLAFRAAGWLSPIAISAYFIAALALNHVLASAVSARVALHQRREGELRARHRWLCSRALDVGLSGGAQAAEMMVNEGLEQALGMQLQVAVRRWALITAADLQMRISSVINYLVIAVAVFAANDSGWVWGASLSMQDLDGPHLTAAISRASFYSLAICQGWSDLVKASIQLGDIRGYANRVRQLLLLVSHNDGRDEGTEERNAGAPGQVLDTAHLPLAALRSRHAIGRGQVVRAPAPRQAQRSAGALDAPAPAPRGAATLAVRVGGADASDMHQRSVGQCNEIAFCDVCVWSPSGDMLVDKLSLVLRQGERLLISGPNGCGKRTLISLHHLLETFLYLYF